MLLYCYEELVAGNMAFFFQNKLDKENSIIDEFQRLFKHKIQRKTKIYREKIRGCMG